MVLKTVFKCDFFLSTNLLQENIYELSEVNSFKKNDNIFHSKDQIKVSRVPL